MTRLHPTLNDERPKVAAVTAAILAALVLAACGSSSSSAPSSGGTTATTSPTAGAEFSTTNVSGLGTVLVDGHHRTVYVLTSQGQKNVPCTSSNGCTNVWPSLPLASASTPTAGSGIHSSLLGTMTLSDGKTYPTYNGWLVYEYTADTATGQATGQGISSFGGTWYVLNPSGNPVTTVPAGSSGGY